MLGSGTLNEPFGSVDFDAGQVVRPDIKTGDHGGDRAVGEIQHGGQVGGVSTLMTVPYLGWLVIVRVGEAGLGRTGDALHRPEHRDQRGQVVGAHVEHRAAADLVVELRIGVPALVTVADHEGGGGHGFANRAVVDQLAAGLDAGAQEGVRRAADSQALLCGDLEHFWPSSREMARGFSL